MHLDRDPDQPARARPFDTSRDEAADDLPHHPEDSGSPHADEGDPQSRLAVERAARITSEGVAGRLRRLQSVTAALADALSLVQVLRVVHDEAVTARS